VSRIRTENAPDCGQCGKPGRLLHAGLTDRLFGTEGTWALLRCAECGLVWVTPRPLAADIAQLYDEYYTHAPTAEPSRFERLVRHDIPAVVLGYDDLEPGLLARGAARIGPLRDAGRRNALGLGADRRGRLLDVGCGAGEFMATMQRLGWDVSGTELDATAAAGTAQRLAPATIHTGRLSTLGLEASAWDAVTLVHVIEHLIDPVAELRECARLLAPGGRLVVVTPNAASLGSRRFGAAWRGWEPPRHIHIYERASLTHLIEAAGLRVCALDTPASAAFYLYLESVRHTSGGTPFAAGLRAIAFWLREYAQVRGGAAVGEELMLTAERTPE